MMVRHLVCPGKSVQFRIYNPDEEETEFQDWSCRFETLGLADNISGRAMGIDAISAMINAMMRVDIFLKSSEEFRSGRLRWEGGSSPDDFGLPWQSANPFLADLDRRGSEEALRGDGAS